MARLVARPQFYRLWWPLVLGVLAMYVPTFYDLATGLWGTEGYAHGPIILILALWLLARQWPEMWQESAGQLGTRLGWLSFLIAWCMYILGRAQDILMFEIGSFVIVLMSLLLMVRGGKALKMQWFPFFFMLFMIPLPGAVVSALTVPMKMAVSYVTEHILYWAGYPIARSGVILQIGQYQLLVADACAGLQTLLTLEALGLFYLNVVKHTAPLRNVLLACLIIPISFTANVIRVVALTLITYYFGDAVGQGFLHGFAGMVLFITALVLIIGVDSVLQYGVKWRENRLRVTQGGA
ncbi:MAG: exosortase B [Deltaproteobacteria bacterium]|nr:exosortase B [Deltaproteobacteria bacterium]